MEYRQANGEDLENFMNVRMEFASSMGETNSVSGSLGLKPS